MGNPRSEISVDIEKLTRHAFARQGYICLYAIPAANNTSRFDALSATEWWQRRQDDGICTWLRWQRDATSIIRTMVTLERTGWNASHTEDGGVLVEVPIDRTDHVLAECLRWRPSIRLLTDEEVDAQTASIAKEIRRRIVRMQATGEMQELNRGYKAARLAPRAEGETFPNLKNWLTREIERRVLLPETLAAITRSADEAA